MEICYGGSRGCGASLLRKWGFAPAIHIRDNLELRPNAYRITLKGAEIGSGEALPGQFLAINPGQVTGTLQGTPTQDPAFGLPAIWVEAALKDHAQALGYTVVDVSTVVATHLSHLIHLQAASLLGIQELHQLLEHVAKSAPKLTEELIPKVLSHAVLQKVLQNLLDEGVPIRDMRSILETLSKYVPISQDPIYLTAQVRVALGPAIIQQLYPASQELQVIAMDKELEHLLAQAMQAGGYSKPSNRVWRIRCYGRHDWRRNARK